MPHSAKSSDFAITRWEFLQNISRLSHCTQSCQGLTCVMQRAHLFNK
jgi:hypothetical protein